MQLSCIGSCIPLFFDNTEEDFSTVLGILNELKKNIELNKQDPEDFFEQINKINTILDELRRKLLNNETIKNNTC